MATSAPRGNRLRSLPGAVVDYRMQRRRLLADIEAGRVQASDACEHHPSLLRVARGPAARLDETCPLCKKTELAIVGYAFGPRLGGAGRCLLTDFDIDRLAARRGRFTVYEVEVCPRCGWNHMRVRYTVGDDQRPPTSGLPREQLSLNGLPT